VRIVAFAASERKWGILWEDVGLLDHGVVEAAIDFLGAGVKYPDTSWGNILADAENSFTGGNWWWATFPGIFLVMTVLSVNFIGDGLGDALDVRSTV